jgi:hypothetical protein
MRPLVPALARRLLRVEHLAALLKGARVEPGRVMWTQLVEELGLAGHSYVDGEWDYRCTKTRVVVERSPVGAGKVTWHQLAELIAAGLSSSEELPKRVIVGLAAVDAGRGPTPTKLRRAGLLADASTEHIAARKLEVVQAVIDRGVIALGGVSYQPSLFDAGSVA